MKLTLLRYNHDAESTQGLLALAGAFECHTLEDQRQAVKVAGETRIPEGTYEVRFREAVTPLTERYRKKFAWFDKHLHVIDVPGFEWICIHIGNKDTHTDGCLLVADTAVNDPNDYNARQAQSTQAFERLYKKISRALKDGERADITIKSIWE